MKRKPPPNKVLTGKNYDRPPIYVKYIERSPIQLNGSAEEFERMGLNPEVPYDDTGPCEKNEELISIMLGLRNLGLVFSYDHKVRFSPSAFMQMLQDQGRLKEKYNEISWRGPGKWTISPMKRKPPPNKVLTGKNYEGPPIYVKYIERSPIQLNGSAEEFERMGLNPEVPYDDTGPCEKNEELISIMLGLRNLGLVFSYDHKVHFSPSAFMQMLQDQGRLKGKYNEISWRGPGKWTITTYEME